MQHCKTIFMPLIQTPLDNTREKNGIRLHTFVSCVAVIRGLSSDH